MMRVMGLITALAAVGLGQAVAQEFPARPMTLIIPFASGGPTDVLGRVIAAHMSETLGKPIIIENIPGGGGQVGGKRVADAAPDGYMMGLGTVGTHAQGQTLYKKPLYNSQTDFSPVVLIADVPIVIAARKDLPVKSLQDFVAYAKANQANMSYGTGGTGSAPHLGCVLLTHTLSLTITHVPYRGTGPATQDLLGGRIDFMCAGITTAKPLIDGGQINGLAVLGGARSPAMPDLPTASEQNAKVEAYTWNAIFLPKGTPEPIVTKLNAAARQAMRDPAVREKLASLGAQITADEQATPEFLARFVKSETDKWAAPIKASGLVVE